jgi:hypothetical protein
MEAAIADATGDETPVRRFTEADREVIVADLGSDHDAHVEIVDGLIIVATDRGTEAELDAPSSDAEAFIRNGVLTIEVPE